MRRFGVVFFLGAVFLPLLACVGMATSYLVPNLAGRPSADGANV